MPHACRLGYSGDPFDGQIEGLISIYSYPLLSIWKFLGFLPDPIIKMPLVGPHSDVPLPPAGRSVNESFSSHHHLEHHRLSVYSWWIMHPPVTLPQVNVQSVVLLQNYPAGHLILGIWLNFSFNYPVLCRAIEDSHKGPLLLMWAICFLSKMPTFPKPPTAPWASSHSFQGYVTLCKHTTKPQHAWRYSKCPFYSSWSSVINPDRNVWIFSSHVPSSLVLAVENIYYSGARGRESTALWAISANDHFKLSATLWHPFWDDLC